MREGHRETTRVRTLEVYDKARGVGDHERGGSGESSIRRKGVRNESAAAVTDTERVRAIYMWIWIYGYMARAPRRLS